MNDFDNKQICSYKDIDRFGFTCDVCGRKVNGCHYINGMSFCEKCYQETFGKDNQQTEITQLKQQLEEKDEQIKKRVMVYEEQFIEQTNEIYSLKWQLAEKDKEIDYWKDKTRNKILNMKATDFMKMCLGCGLMLDITEQQVPLAVRELEKVKVNLKDRISMMKNEEHSYLQKVVAWYDICDQINKQIKVLKGEQQ